MQAVSVMTPGGPEVLTSVELEDPTAGPGNVLIRVAAAGVNRADIGQRQGTYPPPPGSLSPLPGMEVSGTIVQIGAGVIGWSVGDRVCALLPSGGYASLAVASATQLFAVPDSMDLVDAAGLPEALCTVWSNVYLTAGLTAGETLLVHGGSSGIGTIAIQLARALGSLVATTAGSAAKLDACRALGAETLINYRTDDFVSAVLDATEQHGADVILDAIGGGYLDRNLQAIARNGRLVIIGNQSGEAGTLNIGALMGKWVSIHGTTLRARPAEEKNAIVASVRENVWPLIEAGQVVPVIYRRYPLAEAAEAHRRMESSEHIGKILLIAG